MKSTKRKPASQPTQPGAVAYHWGGYPMVLLPSSGLRLPTEAEIYQVLDYEYACRLKEDPSFSKREAYDLAQSLENALIGVWDTLMGGASMETVMIVRWPELEGAVDCYIWDQNGNLYPERYRLER